MLPAQPLYHVLGDRSGGIAGRVDGVRDRRQHLAGIQQRRQLHEHDAVRVALPYGGRRRQHQPGLADPSRAAEGDQPARTQQLRDARDVVVTTDQRGGRHRQVPRPGRGAAGGLPGRAGRHRREQSGPLLLGQVQGRGEGPHRVRVGAGPGPALEGADRVGTQSRALGQLLLREAGRLAQPAQHRAERARAIVAHGPSHRSVRIVVTRAPPGDRFGARGERPRQSSRGRSSYGVERAVRPSARRSRRRSAAGRRCRSAWGARSSGPCPG